MADETRQEPTEGETLEEPVRPDRISLRRAFFTGAVALLPAALTLVLFVWIIEFINKKITEPINSLIIWIMDLAGVEHAREVFRHQSIGDVEYGIIDFSFVGLVIALVIVFIVGLALLTFVGRRLYRGFDRFLAHLPVLRMIYPHVKQLTDIIFSRKKMASFRRVVMIEYPRQGAWSLGFVTGQAMRRAREATGRELISVFVPSSPTPFTGYVVAVPESDLVDLPISVDEALRFVVSGGVLVPPSQAAAPGAAEGQTEGLRGIGGGTAGAAGGGGDTAGGGAAGH